MAAPVFSPDLLSETWPVQILHDDGFPPALAAGLSRWLGSGDGSWRAPGDVTDLPPTLAQRVRSEDAAALSLLITLSHESACTLGLTNGGFGDLEAAWSYAASSCDALDKGDHAARIRQAHPLSTPLPALPTGASLGPLLASELRVDAEVLGETLLYRFAHPGLTDAVKSALAPMNATPAAGRIEDIADRAGSASWTPLGAPKFELPPPAQRDLASLEVAADAHVAAWSSSIGALPPEALDPALRSVALGWVRTAVYAAAAEETLASGDAGSAVTLFEEALGTARPRPGPGRDPVLLCEVAMARWRAGEHARAVELLRDIATQPGWTFAEVPAEMVARVAVIPSATDPRVRR